MSSEIDTSLKNYDRNAEQFILKAQYDCYANVMPPEYNHCCYGVGKKLIACGVNEGSQASVRRM